MGSVERLLELIDAEIMHNSNNTVGGRWSAELHEARQIAAALREQPEARGVVDDAMVERARQAYKASKRWGTGEYPEGPIRSVADLNRNDDDAWRAALTAAQQPVQEGGGEVACPSRTTCTCLGACAFGLPGNGAAALPSAPVGVGEKAREILADEYRQAGFYGAADDALADEPSPHCKVTIKAIERALTQQPAQAASGDRNALWCKKASELLPPWQWNMVNDAVKRELRTTPPGDDAGERP